MAKANPWIIIGLLVIGFAIFSGTNLFDISTPFSDALVYDSFGAGFDSSKWNYDTPLSNTVTENCNTDNGVLKCGGTSDIGGYKYVSPTKDFSGTYFKLSGEINNPQFKVSYPGAGIGDCGKNGVIVKIANCDVGIGGITGVDKKFIEFLPSNLEKGKGWVFVNGEQSCEVSYSGNLVVKLGIPTYPTTPPRWPTKMCSNEVIYNYFRFKTPFSCHIGSGEGFAKQRFVSNEVIEYSSLSLEPRKFCLSQPARIVRDNNLIADAEIYDRISKGQSYTVKSNEFVDVFYIYDEAGCGVDEAFNTKTSSCEPLESFSFSCVNGEFNEQLNGCIVEPIITQGEVTCPEGYTKEVVDGGQACLTSNPDVVQIEPNENYAVSNKQGILGAGLVGDTIGFVVFIALLFIVYLMYRGKKR